MSSNKIDTIVCPVDQYIMLSMYTRMAKRASEHQHVFDINGYVIVCTFQWPLLNWTFHYRAVYKSSLNIMIKMQTVWVPFVPVVSNRALL